MIVGNQYKDAECNAILNNKLYHSSEPIKDNSITIKEYFRTLSSFLLVYLLILVVICLISCFLSLYTRTVYKTNKKFTATTIILLILTLCCCSSFIAMNIYSHNGAQYLKNEFIIINGRPCVKDNLLYNKGAKQGILISQPTHSPLIKSEI